MRVNSHYLAALFEPDSVAVIGATERGGSIGAVLMDNMISAGFTGALYPVNPKYRWVRGRRCYRGVAELPQPIDLATVAEARWGERRAITPPANPAARRAE